MRAESFEEFVSFFVADVFFDFVKIGKSYFLKTDSFEVVPQSSGLVVSGLPLGTQGREFFEPSLFLLELLSEKSSNKVFVNSEAEWLFLCGRDVFLDSVVRSSAKHPLVLVQNEFDENLGLGLKRKMKGKKVIANILDRGDFLRRED